MWVHRYVITFDLIILQLHFKGLLINRLKMLFNFRHLDFAYPLDLTCSSTIVIRCQINIAQARGLDGPGYLITWTYVNSSLIVLLMLLSMPFCQPLARLYTIPSLPPKIEWEKA